MFRTPANAEEGGKFGLALLSIPLYAFMAIMTDCIYLLHGLSNGARIYLGFLVEFSNIFLT
jgi:hypothetical protein